MPRPRACCFRTWNSGITSGRSRSGRSGSAGRGSSRAGCFSVRVRFAINRAPSDFKQPPATPASVRGVAQRMVPPCAAAVVEPEVQDGLAAGTSLAHMELGGS